MNKLIILLISFCLCACKTITKVEKEYITLYDTVKVEDVRYDSIYLEKEKETFTKGDTVFQNVYETKYKEKIKWKDSIQVKIEYKYKIIEKEIVKEEKWYKNYWLYSTIGLLILLITLIKFGKK